MFKIGFLDKIGEKALISDNCNANLVLLLICIFYFFLITVAKDSKRYSIRGIPNQYEKPFESI